MIMNQLNNQNSSFNVLHKILLASVIALGILEAVMKIIRAIPFISLLLVYFILGCERVSNITYKVPLIRSQIIIVVLVFLSVFDVLGLMRLGFLHETERSFFNTKVDNITNGIVIVAIQLAILLYATLISWRAYERNKCKSSDYDSILILFKSIRQCLIQKPTPMAMNILMIMEYFLFL